MNTLEQGFTAESAVSAGEDAGVPPSRVEAWKDQLRPRNELEHYFAERVAHAAWQLDRVDRAIAARREALVRFGDLDRDRAESNEVADLARRLFWHSRGPIALYPHFPGLGSGPRISCPDEGDDRQDSARIVHRLEATYTGCRWLLDRWDDLRRRLEEGLYWQPPDRLRAIRMLGRQPKDAPTDERVLSIYLACDAMDPCAPSSVEDLRIEVDDNRLAALRERVQGWGAGCKRPRTMEAGKAALLVLIEQRTARLERLLATHHERREQEKAMQPDLLVFESSREGELARRHQLARARELRHAIVAYRKLRNAARGAGDAAEVRRERAKTHNPPEPARPSAPNSGPGHVEGKDSAGGGPTSFLDGLIADLDRLIASQQAGGPSGFAPVRPRTDI